MTNYISRIMSVALVGLLLVAGTSQEAKAQDITVSYQTFYDNLAPYGQWIYDPQYGNVWVPNEDGNFRPYGSRGRWVMTEYGNTWVSDDPWGWAVYHYGRWTYNPYYGWVWLPGYEWAPAWVSWRFGGGYAGWAPLGPNISVGVSYYAPDSWWVFVGPQYMYQPNCIRYWYGPSYNPGYIRQTTIINNYYVDNSTRVRYNYGPRAEVIQQFTRQPVRVYQVSQLNRPGAPSVGRNSVSIYRPGVNRGSMAESRPRNVMQAPRGVGRGEAVQQMGEGRQPAFRQEVQRRSPDERGGGRGQTERGNDDNRSTGRFDDRTDNRGQRENQVGRDNSGTQPGRQDTRTQPGRNDNQPGRQDNRPQPGRFDNQSDRQNSGTRQDQPGRQDTRPQPGRNDNQPDRQNTRPQPSQPGRSDTRNENRPTAPTPPSYDRRMDNRSQPNQGSRGTESRPQSQPQPNRETRRTESRPQGNPQSAPQQGGRTTGSGRR